MASTATTLSAAVDEIVNEFEINDDSLKGLVDHFMKSMKEGLAEQTEYGLPMIPSFVTQIPTGQEKGTFLAMDLGGTNVRACSIRLNGDSTYDIVQDKWAVPHEYMIGDSETFFEFLASRLEAFIKKHHADTLTSEYVSSDNKFKMGFTFSFPVNQTSLNRGTLIRWTKGFDIKDAVGKDIVLLLQGAIDKKGLPVEVAALVNDTVGTLVSRSYTKARGGQTLIGCIFGTGTNGAYSEKIKSIPKFDREGHPEVTSKIMVINTEWGSYDNKLEQVPNTRFDVRLNELTPNKGFHMFEKRISGMFLGELLRQVLCELRERGLVCNEDQKIEGSDVSANLETPFSLDTSVPSKIDGDRSSELAEVDSIIKSALGFNTTLEQRQEIRRVAKAIGRRSARLSSVPLAGVVLHTKALEKFEGEIDIGADGSVAQFYPNFEPMVREALHTTLGKAAENRVVLGLATDGSGVGAALCALSGA